MDNQKNSAGSIIAVTLISGLVNPSGWHGGLPPISLVAFACFSVGYIINLLGRE